MSASGKAVCSQDSEWLPTGTSWITFWTAINPGSSRRHTADGTTREVTYLPGQTRHFHCAEGEYLLHDLKTWVTPNWCSRQSNSLTAQSRTAASLNPKRRNCGTFRHRVDDLFGFVEYDVADW